MNVTLANNTYVFDYNKPDSVCGIAHAVRNTALLWGLFAALLVAALICVCLWQRRQARPGSQGGLFSSISTVLGHDRLHCGRQMAKRGWFLVSDVAWFVYSQVAAAITIHQVFNPGQLLYAYLLLAILLLPFLIMFILVVRVSIERCHEHIVGKTLISQAVAPMVGLLFAPLLFLGIELALILHGIGVPLPAWWDLLGVELVTFYRMEFIAEAFANALPQSIVQTKLYLMGNDPNGIHVYIDTKLYFFAMAASLFSMLKTVILVFIELHQYNCNALGYCIRLVKFETFPSLPWVSI